MAVMVHHAAKSLEDSMRVLTLTSTIRFTTALAGSVLLAVTGAATTVAAAAQVRSVSSSTAQSAKVGVAITLQAGGERYDFIGQGSCQHAAQGSIYNTPAESWTVQQNDGNRSLFVVLWRPIKKSEDMVSLTVSTGKTSYIIDTVKAPGRLTKGTGSVSFVANPKGGSLTINGTTASGAKVSGTIKCDAFTPRVAVAGD
jgi:hypothetical protein